MSQIIPLFSRLLQRKSNKTTENIKKEQFFLFKFENKTFAVPAVDVTEVINVCTIVPQPAQKATYFEGVINVRGSVIPIINIRDRIDMPSEYHINVNSKILLYTLKTGCYTGMVVDNIAFSLHMGSVEPLPPAAANEKVFSYADIEGEKYPIFLIDTWLEPGDFEFLQKISAEF